MVQGRARTKGQGFCRAELQLRQLCNCSIHYLPSCNRTPLREPLGGRVLRGRMDKYGGGRQGDDRRIMSGRKRSGEMLGWGWSKTAGGGGGAHWAKRCVFWHCLWGRAECFVRLGRYNVRVR